MRNKVIEWLEKRNYKMIIKQIPTKNIHEYDYCFITNSIKGLRFVKKINSRKYKDPSRLLEVFESLVV